MERMSGDPTPERGLPSPDVTIADNHVHTFEPINSDVVRTKLTKLKEVKKQHRYSESCERPNTCGACHFYSGAINALSDLLGETGVIE